MTGGKFKKDVGRVNNSLEATKKEAMANAVVKIGGGWALKVIDRSVPL